MKVGGWFFEILLHVNNVDADWAGLTRCMDCICVVLRRRWWVWCWFVNGFVCLKWIDRQLIEHLNIYVELDLFSFLVKYFHQVFFLVNELPIYEIWTWCVWLYWDYVFAFIIIFNRISIITFFLGNFLQNLVQWCVL